MKHLSCISEIKQQYSSLTAAEKRIADYILENSASIPLTSIDDLAKNAHTAKSAVIRFCKSLGFTGYPELKVSVAADLSNTSAQEYESYIDKNDDGEMILNKVFASNIRALNDTLGRINTFDFDKLTTALVNAKRVYLYGIGTSAHFAIDLSNRLSQVGYSFMPITDASYIKASTLNLSKDDVALVICHSGKTKVIVEAMKLAKENGAIIACISGYSNSPLKKICDYSIITTTNDIKFPIESISNRTATSSVLDALYIAVSIRNYDDANEKLKKSRSYVDEFRFDTKKK